MKNQLMPVAEIDRVLVLDFETFWDKDGYSLRHLSVPEYVFHPKFQVLLLAVWDLTWPAPKVLTSVEIAPFLAKYDVSNTMVVAHNFLFDGAILAWKYGFVPGRMSDTLGMARALRRYPRYSLEYVAEKLLGQEKGKTVLKTQGLDAAGIKRAGFWHEFIEYALHDVRLCAWIYCKLYPEFPEEEGRIQDLVLRAAICPVLRANVALLRGHLEELRARKAQLLKVSGYDKISLMSTARFREILIELGVDVEWKPSPTGDGSIPAFAKTDPFMQKLLAYHGSYDDDINYQVQALAAARLAYKSTIEETRTEKFIKIASLPWPNGQPLLPMPLRYAAAHTHRLGGEFGMNVQNLPRDKSKSQLRASIVAPPGYKIVSCDLSQIEARLAACLAGQKDLIEDFRAGIDVYSKFAMSVFGRPINKTANPAERFIGKTGILSLQYGSGALRFYQMVTTLARQGQIELTGLFDEEVAQRTVAAYRRTYRQIPYLWQRLDRVKATVLAVAGNATTAIGPMTVFPWRIRLPNGLYLQYDKEQVEDLWGGKLLENACQALARIIVMSAAARLADRGLRMVHQAHDALSFTVAEKRVNFACKIIHDEMTTPPDWMPDLPLAAEIVTGDTYGGTDT